VIRVTLISLLVAFLCAYAWKDWYKSLCGLIVMMAIIEHPDIPKTIFGIPGFNFWNLLFVFVLAGWAMSRRREKLVWDMPKKITFLLILYGLIIVVGFFRMAIDSEGLSIWAASPWVSDDISAKSLFNEYFINTFKWVVPSLLLFHGCRNRSRLAWAVSAILIMYLLLSIQVIRWMPLSALTDGDALEHYGLRFLSKEVGYHRVNLSMMLSGAFWSFVTCSLLYSSKYQKILKVSMPTIFFGLALTGGRMGYATWAAIGGVIAAVRWRRYLVLGPIFVLLVVLFVPAVQERFTAGFDEETVDESTLVEEHLEGGVFEMQLYTITSGRSFAWPFVWEEIKENLLFGDGREAMVRSGVSTYLLSEFLESFPHPHNATLMWIFDNGLLGLLPVLTFYLLMLKYGFSLLRDKKELVHVAIGGMAFSLISALLIASIGSQSFYPREGSVGMWCAIGLMLRVYVEREKNKKLHSPGQNEIKSIWEKV